MPRRSKSRSRAKKMFEVKIVYPNPAKLERVPEYKYIAEMYLVKAVNDTEAQELALWKYVNDRIDYQAEDHYNKSERDQIFKDFMGYVFYSANIYSSGIIFRFGEIEIKYTTIISRELPTFDVNKINYIDISYQKLPYY